MSTMKWSCNDGKRSYDGSGRAAVQCTFSGRIPKPNRHVDTVAYIFSFVFRTGQGRSKDSVFRGWLLLKAERLEEDSVCITQIPHTHRLPTLHSVNRPQSNSYFGHHTSNRSSLCAVKAVSVFRVWGTFGNAGTSHSSVLFIHVEYTYQENFTRDANHSPESPSMRVHQSSIASLASRWATSSNPFHVLSAIRSAISPRSSNRSKHTRFHSSISSGMPNIACLLISNRPFSVLSHFLPFTLSPTPVPLTCKPLSILLFSFSPGFFIVHGRRSRTPWVCASFTSSACLRRP